MWTQKYEEITFTREQFYEKVWSIPTTKVAVELGISDVMVGKVCKSYNIPKPYLGYWAKLQHGKKPKKTALPKSSDSNIQTLIFKKYPDRPRRETIFNEPETEPVYDPDIQQLLDRARALEPVKVADALRQPHSLVAATRDQLKRDQISSHQQFYDEPRKRQPKLDVTASKDLLGRALRIMNALTKRIEKIGGSVEVKKDEWHESRTQTVVCFGGEEVSVIRIRERHKQVRVPQDKKDQYSWQSMELEPTGLLILDTGPRHYGRPLLQDTSKRDRIEDRLNDLIIGFIKKAGNLRIQRCKEEEEQKRQEEKERIRRQKEAELRRLREVLQKRQNAEQARVDELINHAQSWRTSKQIREYLGAFCEMLLKRDGAIAIDGEAATYLRWAQQQADRLDPLRPSAPSVLDERI